MKKWIYMSEPYFCRLRWDGEWREIGSGGSSVLVLRYCSMHSLAAVGMPSRYFDLALDGRDGSLSCCLARWGSRM